MTRGKRQSFKHMPQIAVLDVQYFSRGNRLCMPQMPCNSIKMIQSERERGSHSSQGFGKNHYLLGGKCFTLETDQRPLKTILNKFIVEMSPSLQCFITYCLLHDFTTKSKSNILVNSMSHLPHSKLPTTGTDLPRLYINCITPHVKATILQIMRIKEASTNDNLLLLFKHVIQN